MDQLVARARRQRWIQLAVAIVRIVVGFAFVPAGLKKLIGEPFTDPANVGPFHDFLDAFLATGGFYRAVGVLQLFAATLLMTQRFATLGAALVLPVIAAIAVFCHSTGAGVPTRVVATLLLAATLGLLVWELPRWCGLLVPDRRQRQVAIEPAPPLIDPTLWERCGLAVLALYVAVCIATGEVYRPRGMELTDPAFYVFPTMVAVVVATYLIDRSRRRRDLAAPDSDGVN